MEIYFEHPYGKVEKIRFIHCVPKAIVSKEEEKEALENGWYNWSNEWYQVRSTRINIEKYNLDINYKNIKIKHSNKPKNEYKEIFERYIKAKKRYTKDETPPYDELDVRDFFIEFYYYKHELIGFTRMRNYNGGLESYTFCWDYYKPELELGHLSTHYEISLCKQRNYSHLYLGPGYEVSCFYKSKIPGFEWWTGRKWSQDVEKYQNLCRRDSKIEKLGDLSNV